MMKKNILLVFCSIIIACNGQNKKNEVIKNKNMNELVNDSILPPWDHFMEGEMDFRHSTENVDLNEEINTTCYNLKSLGYKFPREKIFTEKTLDYFKLNVNKYDANVLALNNDLIPYIALKNKHIVYREGLDSLSLLKFNEMLFYDNELSAKYIMSNNPDIIYDLVFVFGYSKKREWINIAIGDNLWERKGDELILFNLLFGEYNILGNEKLELREDMLTQLISMDADLSMLSSVADDILNRDDYLFKKNRKDLAGYLYAMCTELNRPQYGVIKRLLDISPQWKNYFKSKDYYGSKNLKVFIEKIYESKNRIMAIIDDSDGYTNLRKAADVQSSILEQIKTGTAIEVIDSIGNWYYIRTEGGKSGYVHKSRVKKIE